MDRFLFEARLTVRALLRSTRTTLLPLWEEVEGIDPRAELMVMPG